MKPTRVIPHTAGCLSFGSLVLPLWKKLRPAIPEVRPCLLVGTNVRKLSQRPKESGTLSTEIAAYAAFRLTKQLTQSFLCLAGLGVQLVVARWNIHDNC